MIIMDILNFFVYFDYCVVVIIFIIIYIYIYIKVFVGFRMCGLGNLVDWIVFLDSLRFFCKVEIEMCFDFYVLVDDILVICRKWCWLGMVIVGRELSFMLIVKCLLCGL